MTITTLATDQVHVLLDHTIAHALHLDGNVENANNGDDHPVRSSIPSLLEAMSRRRDIRKNKEQIVTPILSSFSQVQTQYSDSQTFEESKELAARRRYLKVRQEERVYNNMMYGESRNPHAEEVLSKSNQFSTFRHQLSLGVNVLFSILAAFGMIWYISKKMLMYDESKSLILGLFGAIAVLIVEMLLFIVRAVRIEDETEKHASTSEESLAQERSGGLVTAKIQLRSNAQAQTPTQHELNDNQIITAKED